MSKFITGQELSEVVDSIIWKANEELVIVSPYIKLDNHFKKLFDKQRHNHKLHILLMFGKNEGRVNKSFNKSDLEYFKQFPNISIVYVANLHAKYYANEKVGVVTSINLYDYSFINNIEFGVLYENKGLKLFNKSTDDEVWKNCWELANANPVLYINRPIYANIDDYRGSKVLCDITDAFYKGKKVTENTKELNAYDDALDFDEVYREMPSREVVEKPTAGPKFFDKKTSTEMPFKPGFCIRTGEKIPFNPKSPYSYDAYKSWVYWGNEDFAEKYCHYSGELSNGQTSMRKPILYKNLNKA